VVHDEHDILLIIDRAGQKHRFQIDSFNDPVKALAHFEKHAGEYSLVLSDLRMPGMSGIKLLNFVEDTARHPYNGDDCIRLRPTTLAGPFLGSKENTSYKPFRTAYICNAVKNILGVT